MAYLDIIWSYRFIIMAFLHQISGKLYIQFVSAHCKRIGDFRMARPRRLTVFIILGLLVTITGLASFSLARLGYTAECGLCHSTSGVLTLTSNATGTVNAYVDTPFALVVESTGYTGGDNEYAISLQADWEDNNDFSFTPIEVQDGSASDENPTTNEIQATLVFTPLSSGTFTIRIWVASAGGLATSLDVTVSVTYFDTTPPVIDHPSDVAYDEGTTGYSITWSPYDLNPYRYTIFREHVSIKSGSWNSSSEKITTSVDGLPQGTYNYTLQVLDTAQNSASDEVLVIVNEVGPPTINSPADILVIEDSVGNILIWDPSAQYPSSYEVFRDDILISSGLWNSTSETISVSLDGLALGEYNFSLTVYDQFDINASDSVLVTVYDGTYPETTHPEDLYYPLGQTGSNITWVLSDKNPTTYSVLRNGTLFKSGIWNTTGESLLIMVDGLPLGLHIFILNATDINGNAAFDTVHVTVFDTDLPYVDKPPDQLVNETTVGNFVIWHPLDLNPSSYIVYRDGSPIMSGAWNSTDEVIMASADGLSLGDYVYTITVTDQDTNTASDTVLVTVFDGTCPQVDHPDDVYYDVGTPGGSVSWRPYDLHRDRYEIYRDGVLIRSSSWNSPNQVMTVSVSGLALGVHNFTIVCYDESNNIGRDTVLVHVLDSIPPTIVGPDDFEYNEGQDGGTIIWDPSDAYPSNYNIYLDEELIRTGLWNSTLENITISASGLAAGYHNFTLLIYDLGHNSATDSVFVTVYDVTAPTIDTPSVAPVAEGDSSKTVAWQPYDLHPASYEIYVEEILSKSGLWNSSSETISISIDSQTLGNFNYTIVVFDEAGLSNKSTVIVTVSDLTAPVIDSPADITYTVGETGGSIVWSPSDLHPVSYEILRDGSLQDSGDWTIDMTSISISVDGLAVGSYTFRIEVTDIGGNEVFDEVVVTVNPLTTSTTTTTSTSTTTTTATTTETTGPPEPLPPHVFISWGVIIATWIGVFVVFLGVVELLYKKDIL